MTLGDTVVCKPINSLNPFVLLAKQQTRFINEPELRLVNIVCHAPGGRPIIHKGKRAYMN